MCGISLVLDPSGSTGAAETVARMHAPIRHRGPDGEGFLALRRDGGAGRCDSRGALPTLATLAVAFRRLRILDLTEAAAQPMPSPDGLRWIVFNGEIYNYRELRRELGAAGRDFRTQGDTEVALAAYEAWGERC